jgi:hypothetical protein
MSDKAKGVRDLNILGNPKVLPDVIDDKQRVARRVDRAHGDQLLQIMQDEELKHPSQLPEVQVTATKKRAVESELGQYTDVELLKLNIQAKLKAIDSKDFKLFDQINKGSYDKAWF